MRSLLAAERSSWLVGVLMGWIVVRLVVCWPVSCEVVVAVGMWLLVSMRTDYVAVITRHSMKSGADETAGNAGHPRPGVTITANLFRAVRLTVLVGRPNPVTSCETNKSEV